MAYMADKWSFDLNGLRGAWEEMDFAILAPVCDGDPAIRTSSDWQVHDRQVELVWKLTNESDHPAYVKEWSFDYEVIGGNNLPTSRDLIREGIWAIDSAENHFISTGFEQTGKGLALFPYFRTHFDDVREIAAETGRRRFRVWLTAGHERQSRAEEGRLFQAPALPLRVGPGETRDLRVMLTAFDTLNELRSILRRNGMLTERIVSGINATITPRSDFFSENKDVRGEQILASTEFCARICEGRLMSLRRTSGSLEMMDTDQGFGDLELLVSNGASVDTRHMQHCELAQGVFAGEADGLRIFRECSLAGRQLIYRWRVRNDSGETKHFSDLRLLFNMNTRMKDGIPASQCVLEHIQIAQDNSFFLYTPCDGTTPMLLCLPLKGTRFEMGDQDRASDPANYRAYVHAAGTVAAARKLGCRWPQPVSELTLAPGQTVEYGMSMQFVLSYEEARQAIVNGGLCDIEAIPGLTIPRGQKITLRVRCQIPVRLRPQYPGQTRIKLLRQDENVSLYELYLDRLGENTIFVEYGDQVGLIEFFATLPLRDLIHLRGRFIAQHQIRDASKWYDGLLAEQNNETGHILSPDDHDLITGWRIYELTCDDPGLSKPAFLASKNAEYPVAEEVEALEYYVEHFVWGGLQRTDQEECPYAIYGIPDWHELRHTRNLISTELSHLWRAYDYPHIALMYEKLYEIGRKAPDMLKRQTKEIYLERAYRTFIALYTYPTELDHSFVGPDGIYGTGFYNELAIVDVINALIRENRQDAAARLAAHWNKKAQYFINQCQDLFCSEYPFDTTGFETTQAVVDWARGLACRYQPDSGSKRRDYNVDDVERFAYRQTACNVACRGNLENKYYLRGSDIRGSSARYLLSYMSQMGGWSLMQEALYSTADPFALLRIAGASMLSSWALVNAGDQESNYGYWFPGEKQNGAAGGGFEPMPMGSTWLEQPHHRGSWYYSCEIDLGLCGGLRGANTVLADDPEFGRICYGGSLTEKEDGLMITPLDGVQRRFHWITATERVHALLDHVRFANVILRDGQMICHFEAVASEATIHIFTHTGQPIIPLNGCINEDGRYRVTGHDMVFRLPDALSDNLSTNRKGEEQ